MQQRSHSFRLEFDATNKILRLAVEGAVTDQFLLDGYVALQKARARSGACVCIVDYTGATDIDISTPGVRQLANTKPIFPLDCFTFNVAPQRLMYGLARMFQAFSSDSRPNFRVVQTMDEALALIGAKSPHFSPFELDMKQAG
jgi:hypothetical protein